jgi:hypothetical protein
MLTGKAYLVDTGAPFIIPFMRAWNEHRGTILASSLRSCNHASKLTCFIEFEVATMPYSVYVIVPVESLTGSTVSNMEGHANAQQWIDSVFLDEIFADNTERLLKHGCPQLL